MTGSSLAPVIIPIVVMISLAVCLIIVYYAASHPEWQSASPAPQYEIADPVGPQCGDPGVQPGRDVQQPGRRPLRDHAPA